MIEINNNNQEKVNLKHLKKLGDFVLEKYDCASALVSVALVSEAKMKDLNYSYRHLNKNTDVLSFPASTEEKEKENFLGEVILNYSQIKRQAKDLGHELNYELDFIFIHGLLHLLGYRDEKKRDRDKMIALGEKLLYDFKQI
ncbi:MAG: rRNA maturation RNase YbeY [Candidatus Pacebacteria bacterium]|nr:rRNA maturation RNase YbeY [Candidatus Paceibacterota bacterium]